MAIYSTFLQRAYDQVVHDIALQNLPVRFCMDRAGLVGADGATHAGAFDLAYLCCLPNMTVMAAADEAELVHMVATLHAHDSGPSALRYPRGEGVGIELPERGEVLPIGKGRVVREDANARVAILSLGTRLAEALKAADTLADQGVAVTVADARFAKPLDEALILDLASRHEVLLTIEEGSRGGFGAMVLHFSRRRARWMRAGCGCGRSPCRTRTRTTTSRKRCTRKPASMPRASSRSSPTRCPPPRPRRPTSPTTSSASAAGRAEGALTPSDESTGRRGMG